MVSVSHGVVMIGERFQLGSPIGEGDFAVVHFALDTVSGDTVAVKVFDRKRRNFSLKRVNNEIASLKRISSIENCVSLVGVYESSSSSTSVDDGDVLNEFDDCVFLVTSFAQGSDLQRKIRLAKSGLPVELVMKCFSQLVESVHHCHALGVYHRDIKPANLVINERTNSMTLVDFGSSMISETGLVPAESCGSPAITPPEVASGIHKEVKGEPLDVWALGITLYMMLTGSPLFRGGSIFELYEKICCEHTSVEFPSHIPSEVTALLGQMLFKDASRRIKIREILRHPLIRPNLKTVNFDTAAVDSSCQDDYADGLAGTAACFLDCTPAEQLMLGMSSDASLVESGTCALM